MTKTVQHLEGEKKMYRRMLAQMVDSEVKEEKKRREIQNASIKLLRYYTISTFILA